MKHAIIYIGILSLAAGCGNFSFRPEPGDLLFQVGETSEMRDAIEAATGSEGQLDTLHASINFTHVAIAVRSAQADSVIEATADGGVRMTSLADFLSKSARIGGKPAIIVMRLRDSTGAAQAVAHARAFLGQPYDYSFLPDNGRMYCSELVWESFLAPDGSHRFPAQPMNFRASDGSMPTFWQELFERLGEPIPQGIPGTNPNELSRDTALKSIHSYYK